MRECGDIGLLFLGRKPIVFLSSPTYAHALLSDYSDSIEKSPSLRLFLQPLLGDGVLTCPNTRHRDQRKRVMPAFHMGCLRRSVSEIVAATESAYHSWHHAQVIDISREMTRLTLRIIGKMLFDCDLLDEADQLTQAHVTALRWHNWHMNRLMSVPLGWSVLGNWRFRRAIRRLDTTIYGLLTERRQRGANRDGVLSMLLQEAEQAGSSFTDKQIRDELMTLFLAGHETTASALTWTWYLLSQYPDVALRWHIELDTVLNGRAPTWDDLPQLPYTLQIIKESLRLYPPAYMIARQAQRPLFIGSYTIPKGWTLMLSPYAIHRRPDLFSEPERFNPDRFAPEAEQPPRYAYLPFGAGPRVCLGRQFAMMEAQLILATIGQRMQFTFLPGQRLMPELLLVLRPRGPVDMRVERR